uniref:Malate dehydrogenase n=1 Tax=Tanacetum cinerariifolium TaxID=118510 RepID=A0A699I0F2_TANCI|nr:malate dehydrogenase [Tanacetum cinerariifolium]
MPIGKFHTLKLELHYPFVLRKARPQQGFGIISKKLNVQVSDVKNVIIWGNHSLTQYPDITHATVGDKPIIEFIKDDEWLKSGFISTVQQRGASIIKARKLSSALSAVSIGVYSDGSYNVLAVLIYSFTVTFHNGEWSIVQGRVFVFTIPIEIFQFGCGKHDISFLLPACPCLVKVVVLFQTY